ncbi:hypothetical protein AAMO2058_000849200 [Amorphochlora amoebiformis]
MADVSAINRQPRRIFRRFCPGPQGRLGVWIVSVLMGATALSAVDLRTIPGLRSSHHDSQQLDTPSDVRARYWSSKFRQPSEVSGVASHSPPMVRHQEEIKPRGSSTVPGSPLSPYDDDSVHGSTVMRNDQDPIPAQLSVREGLLGQRIQELESHGESVTIMCVGESGVGKSTLLSNIFTVPIVHSVPKPTVKIVETSVKFECDSIPITVHLIDTPGYGDGLNIRSSFQSVRDYLEARFKQALKRENQIDRQERHILDTRMGVDAILYFFSPHRCKTVDLEFLKSIQGYATIIPILAKADTMTADELAEFRSTVIKRLKETGIKVFHSPFAIISSPYVVRSHQSSRGELVHGREYPWGTAESENELHSDLPALRRCLITEGLSELHDSTRRYYERYRAEHMTRKNNVWNRFLRAASSIGQTALILLVVRELPKSLYGLVTDLSGYEDERPTRAQRGM